MTDRWYLVTSWRKDGSARHKIDITDEMHKFVLRPDEEYHR